MTLTSLIRYSLRTSVWDSHCQSYRGFSVHGDIIPSWVTFRVANEEGCRARICMSTSPTLDHTCGNSLAIAVSLMRMCPLIKAQPVVLCMDQSEGVRPPFLEVGAEHLSATSCRRRQGTCRRQVSCRFVFTNEPRVDHPNREGQPDHWVPGCHLLEFPRGYECCLQC